MAYPISDTPKRFGKYRLIDRVAAGGMAEIFLALEETAHGGRRFVTIKCIRPEHADDPDYLDFFLTEGRVSLRCTHPNLPQVYELGESEGTYYIAMELIHGHTLLDALRGAIRARRHLSASTIMGVGLAVSAALEHAHSLRDIDGDSLQVIHRDVTPQNIMLTTSGTVKLIDFGIVRSTIQIHKTADGIVKGKFAYMAPEQLQHRNLVDHRADLFALGVVLWESIAARPLFRASDDLETIKRVQRMEIPPPVELRADIPRELSEVVLTALERDPARRYPSATAMLRALEHACEQSRLLPSSTRMRDELEQLCGAPEMPAVPPDVVIESTKPRLATGSDAEARAPSEEPVSGLSRDPLLSYFLRQASALEPEAPGAVVQDAAASQMEKS